MADESFVSIKSAGCVKIPSAQGLYGRRAKSTGEGEECQTNFRKSPVKADELDEFSLRLWKMNQLYFPVHPQANRREDS